MKLKSFLLLLFAAITAGSSAQVTVDVFINGTKSGQYLLKEGQQEGGISYNKKIYKSMDRLSIQIKGKSVDGGYFRKVEITGDGNSAIFTADETVGAGGQFILTDKAVFKRLNKGKPINLYVVKTPANTKSSEGVSKVFIGTLSTSKK
jgi:hypothetical protein